MKLKKIYEIEITPKDLAALFMKFTAEEKDEFFSIVNESYNKKIKKLNKKKNEN